MAAPPDAIRIRAAPSARTSPTSVPNTTPGTTPGGNVDPGNGGGGNGLLSFTGADSADLAILGATAVVVGRALYVVGRRPDEEEPGVKPD